MSKYLKIFLFDLLTICLLLLVSYNWFLFKAKRLEQNFVVYKTELEQSLLDDFNRAKSSFLDEKNALVDANNVLLDANKKLDYKLMSERYSFMNENAEIKRQLQGEIDSLYLQGLRDDEKDVYNEGIKTRKFLDRLIKDIPTGRNNGICRITTVGVRLSYEPSALCESIGTVDRGGCDQWNYCEDKNLLVSLSTNPNDMSESDILVLAADEYARSQDPWGPIEKKDGQMWSVVGYESFVYLQPPHSPFDISHNFFLPTPVDARLDVSMGYSRSQYKLHASFFHHDVTDLLHPVDITKKTELVSVFFSHDRTYNGVNRITYTSRLMLHMKVDSYGLWNTNKAHPPELEPKRYHDRTRSKLRLLSRYKFTLAFENTSEDDWVTEKIWQPLISGCVPIFLGASNIDEIVPMTKSFINVRDFPDPKDLADYLNYLDKNDTAYMEYFKWKNDPLPDSIIQQSKKSFKYNLCRLCDYYWTSFSNETSL